MRFRFDDLRSIPTTLEFSYFQLFFGEDLISHSIEPESLENFKIKCVNCYCLILYIEYIEGKFRSFPTGCLKKIV